MPWSKSLAIRTATFNLKVKVICILTLQGALARLSGERQQLAMDLSGFRRSTNVEDTRLPPFDSQHSYQVAPWQDKAADRATLSLKAGRR